MDTSMSMIFTDDSIELQERNYYNLRSRKVLITTPKPYKETRKNKKISPWNEPPKKKIINQKDVIEEIEDFDSGFVDDCKTVERNISTISKNTAFGNWKKALNWVEKRRDTGLYIECCNLNCKKFRYCEDYHDPLDVPELWLCHNLGKGVTCATPEEVIPYDIEQDLIENIYTAGSLVWARFPGFPWWPAMVCDSSDTLSYYLLKPPSNTPIKYHVVYFSNSGKVETSWLTPRNLKPFANTPKETVNKRMIYRGKDYTQEVDAAYDMASAILRNKLTIAERLAGYSYLSRLGGYSPSLHNNTIESGFLSPVSSDIDFIPGTPQKTPKFRKYIRRMKARKLFT